MDKKGSKISIYALRECLFENMIKEMVWKASLYNWYQSITVHDY